MILVLVGGTGSLGKAILQQQAILEKHGITKIRVLSRDEQKQVGLMRSYQGKIPLDCYLGDVQNRRRMIFALKDANFVVHAAAQKHIDKFELDIPTGYSTNIYGTQNVADGFLHAENPISGIFVSTDKAAAPITAYGVSKLAAEHLWFWHNSFQKKTTFSVARYGNIFGSRGSVIETWMKCAKEKKPMPITDETATRFLMKIEDAAAFVLNSLFLSDTALHIPEMKSTAMIELAQVIWKLHHPKTSMKIETIGMRGIEKRHEVLKADGKSSFYAPHFTQKELVEMIEHWRDHHAEDAIYR